MRDSIHLSIYDPELSHREKIRVLSTFSGISAAGAAWDSSDYEFVGYCEPEPFQSHVLHYRRGASRPKYLPESFAGKSGRKWSNYRHIPEEGIPNFGDITQITDDDLRQLGRVDVLEGGSPCQGFSVAGMRKGMEDPRSNLLLAFCELADRMREINGLKFVVWENVHGILGKKDSSNGFGSFWEQFPDQDVRSSRQGKDGLTLVRCWDQRAVKLPGGRSTLNTGESPNGGSAFSLSLALDHEVPLEILSKYCLSGKAVRGILRRRHVKLSSLPIEVQSALSSVANTKEGKIQKSTKG